MVRKLLLVASCTMEVANDLEYYLIQASIQFVGGCVN